MKRIYLLSLLLTAVFGSAIAQKSANLQLTSTVSPWLGGNKILLVGSAAPKPDTFRFAVKNLGPNDLTSADTLHFATPYGDSFIGSIDATKGLKKDSTVYFIHVQKIGPGTLKSQSATIDWCDSVWATSNGAVIMDVDDKNNTSCTSIELTVWATGVANVDLSANVMSVYPNPANNVVNVKFDFGTKATGTLVVRDMLGKAVYQQNLGTVSGEKEYSVDIANLSAGLYFVELTANEAKKVAKITVQK